MKSARFYIAMMFLAAGLSSSLSAKDLARWNSQIVAGWIEPVFLAGARNPILAKLDTGARTSSLNAVNLKSFTRQKNPWVTFTLQTDSGEQIQIEQPVIRIARINRAGVGVRERPVIRLALCLAGYREEVEFTLADRSSLKYPVLIGRSFLANRIIVNSDATHLTAQSCNN